MRGDLPLVTVRPVEWRTSTSASIVLDQEVPQWPQEQARQSGARRARIFPAFRDLTASTPLRRRLRRSLASLRT